MGLRQATRLALFQHLYPIRLIRQNAQEIGLTDRQTKRIQQVVSAARSDIEKRKWDYARETKKLTELVEQNASKNKVLKQMDVLFEYERQIKKQHLGLLIDVKYILTPKQRKQLDAIRDSILEPPVRGGRGGPPPEDFGGF